MVFRILIRSDKLTRSEGLNRWPYYLPLLLAAGGLAALAEGGRAPPLQFLRLLGFLLTLGENLQEKWELKSEAESLPNSL